MSDIDRPPINSLSKPNADGSPRGVRVTLEEIEDTPPPAPSKDQPAATNGSKTPYIAAKDLPSSPDHDGSKLPGSAPAAGTSERTQAPATKTLTDPNNRNASASAPKPHAGPVPTVTFTSSSSVASPPDRLSDHMRRGNKSVRRSQNQSMIRECFASPSPGYHLEYLSPYTPMREAQIPMPALDVIEEPEQASSGATHSLKFTPISQAWRFSSAMRIKADLEYLTPYGVRVQFPASAAEHLLFFSNPEDSEIILAELLDLSDAGEIPRDWLHSLVSYPPLLRAVVRVAELITPTDGVLDPKSPCARVIDALLDNYNVGTIIPAICSPLVDGTVALRHVLRKSRPVSAFTSPMLQPMSVQPTSPQGILIPPVLDHACNIISKSGADSVASIHAFRLVEATLAKIYTLDDMQKDPLRYVAQSITHLLKNKDLRRRGERSGMDAARRTAALQLVSTILRSYKRLLERVEAESETPEMPEEEWLMQDLAVSDIVQYLEDDEADAMVRCMALRVIHDFASVDLDEVPRWKHLEKVASTCADVMLWQTTWQHDHEEKAVSGPTFAPIEALYINVDGVIMQKSLDIVGFCPHDEAYHILSFAPSELVVRVVSKALAITNKTEVLEPLLSLIVDHSTLKDRYWPFMLSILIHSGCLSFFHEILKQSVGAEEDVEYRTKCREISDACIGLTRCFEQMRAKDMKAVPSDISLTLEKLEKDDGMTSLVRSSASAALAALNENVGPSFEITLSASLRSRTPLDSVLRSPQLDSGGAMSSSAVSA